MKFKNSIKGEWKKELKQKEPPLPLTNAHDAEAHRRLNIPYDIIWYSLNHFFYSARRARVAIRGWDYSQ